MQPSLVSNSCSSTVPASRVWEVHVNTTITIPSLIMLHMNFIISGAGNFYLYLCHSSMFLFFSCYFVSAWGHPHQSVCLVLWVGLWTLVSEDDLELFVLQSTDSPGVCTLAVLSPWELNSNHHACWRRSPYSGGFLPDTGLGIDQTQIPVFTGI